MPMGPTQPRIILNDDEFTKIAEAGEFRISVQGGAAVAIICAASKPADDADYGHSLEFKDWWSDEALHPVWAKALGVTQAVVIVSQ